MAFTYSYIIIKISIVLLHFWHLTRQLKLWLTDLFIYGVEKPILILLHDVILWSYIQEHFLMRLVNLRLNIIIIVLAGFRSLR